MFEKAAYSSMNTYVNISLTQGIVNRLTLVVENRLDTVELSLNVLQLTMQSK
jgi:hypothetical protein